ncbi:MAG: ATP-binding protein [Spirochaetia bacterium]|nr:ATP-binding protein [Spirochaetia bacterium]
MKANTNIIKSIRKRQYLVLGILLLFAVFEILIGYFVSSLEQNTAMKINIAGRQRMISQSIMVKIHQLVEAEDENRKTFYKSEIKNLISTYKNQLNFLLGETKIKNKSITLTQDEKDLYYGGTAFTIRDSEAFLLEVEKILSEEKYQTIEYLSTAIIKTADIFIKLLDSNAQVHQIETEKTINKIKNAHLLLFLMFLMTVSIIGAGIFRNNISILKNELNRREEFEKLLNEAQRIAQLGSFKIDHLKNEITWSEEKHYIYEVNLNQKPNFDLFLSIVHPEDKELVKKTYLKAIETGKAFDLEFKLLMADNRIKYIYERLETKYDENKNPLVSYGSCLDITERVRAHDDLELYRLMIEKSGDPIFLIDDNDKCKMIYVNEAAVTHFGVPKEEILTWRIPDWDPNFSFDKLDEHVEEVKKIKNLFIESQHKIKGGKEIVPVEISLNFVMYKGRMCHFGYFKNISERKKKEEDLIKAKIAAEAANKAKSDFVANMSHEIRTPMNAIMGFTNILNEKISDPQHKSYLKSINSASKTLLTLINDILDMSKIEAGALDIQYNAFNPHEMLKDIKSVFEQKISEKNIEFILDIEPQIPGGLIHDEIRLRQILLNLIGNAVKFTEKGYVKLSVTKEYTEEDTSKINLKFSVEDTGIGIKKEDQDNIFKAFLQSKDQSHSKYGGTGLGLTITKRLVEMMGGTISLESEQGKGTKFYLNIKNVAIASIEIDKKKDNINDKNFVFEEAKILVVDDIAENRELVKGYLEKYDFDMIEAENGEIGVNLAETHQPNLIFMDMRMPVMDGYDAIKILKEKENTKQIPIIALTASGMKSSEEKIKTITEGYLRKPIHKKDLINEIAKHISYKELEKSDQNNKEGKSIKDEEDINKQFQRYILGDDKIERPQNQSSEIIQELINQVEIVIKANNDTLSESSSFSDFRIFTEKLKEINTSYNNEYLLIFIDKLYYHLNLFDMLGLLKTVNAAKNLMDKLNS